MWKVHLEKKIIDCMWNIQRMSFYVENLHRYNDFFGRVWDLPVSHAEGCRGGHGSRPQVRLWSMTLIAISAFDLSRKQSIYYKEL